MTSKLASRRSSTRRSWPPSTTAAQRSRIPAGRVTTYKLGVALPMARRAQRDEIRGRVVQLVPIDVMNMKTIPPARSVFAAVLARPVVAVADLTREHLPVAGVRLLGDSTLPRRIFRADLAASMGGTRISYCDPEIDHRLPDRGRRHTLHGSDLCDGHLARHVMLDEPVGAVVRTSATIVTSRVHIPTALATPFDRRAAATRATRRAPMIRAWFALSSRLGLPPRASGYTAGAKQILDRAVANLVAASDRRNAHEVASISRRYVHAHRLVTLLVGQLAVVLSSRQTMADSTAIAGWREVTPMGHLSVRA